MTGTRIDDGFSDPMPIDGRVRSGSSWPNLKDDLQALGPALGPSRPARVAIASYEFTGVVRNGGIGTACTSLARALAADGHEVDLVYTGCPDDPSDEGFDRWRAHYEELGLRLDRIDLDAVTPCDSVLYNAAHSLALYRLLRDRDREQPYDAIHFVESVGHGFYSLLAKQQGLAFERATTVVGVHSPRRWLAEAHGVPFDDALELGDEFLERRSIELADVVVSPSAHMLDWLERHGVHLPERSYVQQYVTYFDRYDSSPRPDLSDAGEEDRVQELVFFGRLEPRKGLMVFCDALDRLADGSFADLERVTFLGRPVAFGETLSSDYVRERARFWPWHVEILEELDRDAALEYLGGPNRLAVMPSSMDNSPNTVYEAIGLGLAFIASRGGGTAELVHPDDLERVTYDPADPEVEEIDPGNPATTRPRHTGWVLAARLEEALASPARRARFAVEPASNRRVHVAWHRAIAVSAPATASRMPSPSSTRLPELVDVRHLVDSLEGVSALVFLADPDVEPASELAATLTAAARACPDAAFFTSLGTFRLKTAKGDQDRLYLAVGGSAASGLAGNCFGTGVVLARRDALERIGVLPDGLPAGMGVGGLLARAALAGERVDVVPEALYRLPVTAAPTGSLSRAQDSHESLAAYHRALAGRTACDIASVARRALGDRSLLRARAEAAEHAAAEAEARLQVIVSSRSWRMTGALRRAGATLRRKTRRRSAS